MFENSKDLRCFIGIFFDDKTLLKIEEAIFPLKKIFSPNQIRWVPLDQIHITLRFLGRTTAQQVMLLQKDLNDLANISSVFSICLDKIVYFPCEKRPRLLALMSDFPKSFEFLVNNLESLIRTMGFSPETRHFISHISLARFKRFYLPPMGQIISLNHTFLVSEFNLIKSETLPTGACYTSLATFKLNGKELPL